MGVDCNLYTNNKMIQLDRWYVFSDFFEANYIYSQSEMLLLLKKLVEKTIQDYIKQEMSLSDFYYWMHYITDVYYGLSERNVFVLDDDNIGYKFQDYKRLPFEIKGEKGEYGKIKEK